MKSLKVSVDALASADAALYAQLVVFPANAMVTEGAVLTLWGHSGGLTERRGRSLLAELWNKALIRVERPPPRAGELALHEPSTRLLRRPPNDDLVSLNRTLVGAYARKAPKGWSSGPTMAIFEHFAPHLVGAGRSARASRVAVRVAEFDAGQVVRTRRFDCRRRRCRRGVGGDLSEHRARACLAVRRPAGRTAGVVGSIRPGRFWDRDPGEARTAQRRMALRSWPR